MNIHLERSGGFAGVRQSHDIDSSQLSPDEGNELTRLLDTSCFFDLPEKVHAPNPGADRFQYRLTVKSGPQEHTVSIDDAAVPENLRALLNWVNTKSRAAAQKL